MLVLDTKGWVIIIALLIVVGYFGFTHYSHGKKENTGLNTNTTSEMNQTGIISITEAKGVYSGISTIKIRLSTPSEKVSLNLPGNIKYKILSKTLSNGILTVGVKIIPDKTLQGKVDAEITVGNEQFNTQIPVNIIVPKFGTIIQMTRTINIIGTLQTNIILKFRPYDDLRYTISDFSVKIPEWLTVPGARKDPNGFYHLSEINGYTIKIPVKAIKKPDEDTGVFLINARYTITIGSTVKSFEKRIPIAYSYEGGNISITKITSMYNFYIVGDNGKIAVSPNYLYTIKGTVMDIEPGITAISLNNVGFTPDILFTDIAVNNYPKNASVTVKSNNKETVIVAELKTKTTRTGNLTTKVYKSYLYRSPRGFFYYTLVNFSEPTTIQLPPNVYVLYVGKQITADTYMNITYTRSILNVPKGEYYIILYSPTYYPVISGVNNGQRLILSKNYVNIDAPLLTYNINNLLPTAGTGTMILTGYEFSNLNPTPTARFELMKIIKPYVVSNKKYENIRIEVKTPYGVKEVNATLIGETGSDTAKYYVYAPETSVLITVNGVTPVELTGVVNGKTIYNETIFISPYSKMSDPLDSNLIKMVNEGYLKPNMKCSFVRTTTLCIEKINGDTMTQASITTTQELFNDDNIYVLKFYHSGTTDYLTVPKTTTVKAPTFKTTKITLSYIQRQILGIKTYGITVYSTPINVFPLRAYYKDSNGSNPIIVEKFAGKVTDNVIYYADFFGTRLIIIPNSLISKKPVIELSNGETIKL